MNPTRTTRRQFIAQTAAAAFTLAADGASAQTTPHKPLEKVRVGFVGVGWKGSAHLGTLLRLDGVEVRAVCDIVEAQCVEAQKQAERLGKKPPTAYFKGERDFVRMCETEELDLVYTATPWEWHVPVCAAALKNGKHAATEVPAALTLDECWQLVELSEKHGRHCVMMENTNYQRPELAIFNMVRKGLLGELVHGEGGYMHDTRYLKIKDTDDGLWLGAHHATRNGNLYPTHGMGPLAWYMNINRGDRLEHLVSMSSNARGMNLYAKEHLPEGHPKRRDYRNGDVNTSLIRTANGLSITIKHDTDLPRPYSRTNLVQGTRGIVRGYPEFKVCLEANSKNNYLKWEPGEAYLQEHMHPLWKLVDEKRLGFLDDKFPRGAITAGAVWPYLPVSELASGDFLEDYRLIEALRNGTDPDYDVYDAVTWSAIAPLSEQSVAKRSAAVEFPDFTRGKWKTMPPVKIMGV